MSTVVTGPVLAGLKSGSDSARSVEAPAVPSGPVIFTDVTEEAGLIYDQFIFPP